MGKFIKTKQVVILALIVIFTLGAIPISASAVTLVRDGIFVGKVEDDNTVSLIEYKGTNENVVVPSKMEGYTVSSIFRNCFRGEEYSSNIKSIEIPAGVTMANEDITIMFAMCTSLEQFIVDQNSEEFSSIDGVLFNKEKTLLLSYPQNKAGESYSVPESVSDIYLRSFYGNNNIKTLNILGENCAIGNKSIYNMKAIERINMPNSIAEASFFDCPNLKEVYFGKYAEERFFYTEGCPNIKFFVYKGSDAEKIAIDNDIPYEYRTDVVVDEESGVSVSGVFDMNSILKVNSKIPDNAPESVVSAFEIGMSPDTESQLEISIPSEENQYIYKVVNGEYQRVQAEFKDNAYVFNGELGTYAVSQSQFIVPSYTVGDVDGDGELTITDVTGIQMYLVKLKDLNAQGLSAADYNGDGAINIIDSACIQLQLAQML